MSLPLCVAQGIPRGFIPAVGALQLLASSLLVPVCRAGAAGASGGGAKGGGAVDFSLTSVEPDEEPPGLDGELHDGELPAARNGEREALSRLALGQLDVETELTELTAADED